MAREQVRRGRSGDDPTRWYFARKADRGRGGDDPTRWYFGRKADTDPTDDAGFRKTRGTQLGSTRRGPRGQKQSFRRFAGDNMGTINTMSVGKLVMGYLAVGLTFYVIGYGIAEGQKAAK